MQWVGTFEGNQTGGLEVGPEPGRRARGKGTRRRRHEISSFPGQGVKRGGGGALGKKAQVQTKWTKKQWKGKEVKRDPFLGGEARPAQDDEGKRRRMHPYNP